MQPYGFRRKKIGTTQGKANGKICYCRDCRYDRAVAMAGRKKRARWLAKKEILKDLE